MVLRAAPHERTQPYPSYRGKAEIIRELLAAGADIRAWDKEGDTALYLAARFGKAKAVHALLDARASLPPSSASCSPAAASRPQARRVRRSSSPSRAGTTPGCGTRPLPTCPPRPIQRLWRMMPPVAVMLDSLLKRGGPVCRRAGVWSGISEGGDLQMGLRLRNAVLLAMFVGGVTSHASAQYGLECDLRLTRQFWVKSTAAGIKRCFLGAGADVNARSKDGRTALHLAAAYNSAGNVQMLLGASANIDARDIGGQTALHWAVRNGSAGIAQVLLDAGADVNARDIVGRTALHWAARNDSAGITQVLLNAGAGVDARSDDGWTTLHWAASYGPAENIQVLQMLLDAGADVNAQSDRGVRALHLAAGYGSAANIRVPEDSYDGSRIVVLSGHDAVRHMRFRYGSSMTVRALLDAGADINAHDKDGLTALHWAAESGLVEQVRALLDAGADPTEETGAGKLPFDFAEAGRKAMEKYLTMETYLTGLKAAETSSRERHEAEPKIKGGQDFRRGYWEVRDLLWGFKAR